jgi:hypothetical protein
MVSGSRAEEAAEMLVPTKNSPQALKREHRFNGLAARLKSGPSQNLRESEFFCSL